MSQFKLEERKIKLLFLSLVLIWGSGCANFGLKMKSLLSGKQATVQVAKKKYPRLVKYSENQKAGFRVPRKYKRMTRNRMEQEAKLESQAGSLWIQEGQGSYLFAQNIMRRPGDIINVSLTGGPRKQLESKVKIIKKLMNRLERRNKMRRLAAIKKNKSRLGKKEKKEEVAKDEKNTSDTKAQADKEKVLDVDFVPSRIVERLVDGNYRVRGNQNFMIGKKEYRIIVTGIVRADDFNDEGIAAPKLLDPQFDIVSMRRSRSRF